MINKRGVSTIVANVIIIMLTLLAIVIIASFVVPFVRDNLNKSTECIDYRNYLEFNRNLNYNCIDINGNYLFSVTNKGNNGLDENFKGFKAVFYGSDISKGIEVSESSVNVEVKGIPDIVTVPKAGETYSYNYTDSNQYDYIELYVLLQSGRTCETSNDKITLKGCEL